MSTSTSATVCQWNDLPDYAQVNVRLETRTRLQLPFDADDFEVLLFEDAVILPRRNRRDVEDVPEELRVVFMNDTDGVLRHALTPAVTRVRPAARAGRAAPPSHGD